MKALVVTPYYFPTIGGLENYARQLNIALQKNEHWDIVVVSSGQAGQPNRVEHIDNTRVYRLRPLLKFSNTPVNPLWPLMIRKIIRREKPDVIIAHSPVPSTADAAALAAGRTPFILVYHAATLIKQGSPVFNAIARVYGIFGSFTMHRANRIFAVSDFVRDQFSPKLQKKTLVVPNAVWPNEIRRRAQPDKVNFVFIASLDRSHSWKGLSQIIKAVDCYRKSYGDDINLTVIGDGNHRGAYENQVAEARLTSYINFAGYKTGSDKYRLLKSATALLVYPTTANDAFPTVILEAWARFVPVIAAAIGPMPSLIRNNLDGYILAPHSPKQLAKVMHKVASSPRSERAEIAETAANRTRSNYTWNYPTTIVRTAVEQLV